MARWTIKFASQPDADYEYEITPGWTEVSTWSEELDSASVAFGQVSEANRLSNLKPYEFCRIFDRENGTSREWLVDSFQEDEIDTIKHLYRYQLTLMSETKLLEKVQLPNIAIMHSLTESNPTIEDKIDSLLTRYVPWVVSGTADSPTAIQLITRGTETIDGLDNECKEINLNAPTLREAITTLTTQIGALPVVENRELNFLDLREAGNTDFEESGITSVSRSNSSDAFTTAIDTQTDRMIDQTGSGVRTEITTFRNPDGAVLKLNGNAVLPVDFPIYTIQKVLASTYGWITPYNGAGYYTMKGVNAFYHADFPTALKNGTNGTATSRSTISDVKFYCKTSIVSRDSAGTSSSAVQWTLVDRQVLTISVQALHCENLSYDSLYGVADTNTGTTGWRAQTGIVDGTDGEVSISVIQPENTTDYLFYAFPRYQDSNGNEQTFLALWGTRHSLFPVCYSSISNTGTFSVGASIFFQKALIIQPCIDLTSLFKEDSERQLLSTDWNDFYTWTGSSTFGTMTIDQLATYYYSTIGYSIGDSEISGWSDTFNDTVWWWDNEHTVGEIIYDWFIDNYEDELVAELQSKFSVSKLIEIFIHSGNLPDGLAEVLRNPPLSGSIVGGDGASACWGYLQFGDDISDYNFSLTTRNRYGDYGDGFADLTNASYLNMIFSITYQPISIVNIQSFKDRDEEGAFRIQNYDTPSDAYANFDDFMTAERDKVNRLGEDIVLINQRVRDENLIQDVGTRFRDDYIVYKREVAHWQGFCTAQYYASRDAVAKNFSTALQRKYRAYENVDYNQSVTRLENRTIFAYIWVSNTAPSEPPTGIRQLARVRVNHPSALIYGTSEPLRMGIEGANSDSGALYQFDLSTMSHDNGFALAMMERDNATFGAQLLISEYNEMTGDGVGGVPQQWIALPSGFRARHRLAFTTRLDNYKSETANLGFDYPELPYTWSDFIAEESSDYVSWSNSFTNDSYYQPAQDIAEVCGYTTQFEFWKGDIPSTLVRINWRNFARFQPWIRNPNNPETLYWGICTNANIDSSFNEGNGEAYSTTSANYSTAPLKVEVDDADTGLASVYASGIPLSSVNNWVILSGTDNATGKRYDIMALRLTALTGTARLNVQLTEFKTKRRMTEDSEGYIRFDEDTD